MEGCSIHPWWEGTFSLLLCIRQDEKGRQSSLICSCQKVVFVMDGWISKMGHSQTMERYSALERKGVVSGWSQRQPKWLLSFLALFTISPFTSRNVVVSVAACGVITVFNDVKVCKSSSSEDEESALLPKWKHKPHAGGGWGDAGGWCGPDFRWCYTTLVTGCHTRMPLCPL